MSRIFNGANIILGILGVIFSVYQFSKEGERYSLSYYQNSIKILDYLGEGLGFSIIDKDGFPLRESVYSSDVVIWNSGDKMIDSSMIINNLEIIPCEKCKILAVVLKNAASPYSDSMNIIRPEVGLVGSDRVDVRWKNLEPRSGFIFTIVYASSQQSKIKLFGHISYIGLPKEIDNKYFRFPKFELFMLMVCVFMLVSLPITAKNFIDVRWRDNKLGAIRLGDSIKFLVKNDLTFVIFEIILFLAYCYLFSKYAAEIYKYISTPSVPL